jgi:ribonuclease VapC
VIVVDASALLAIVLDEPEAMACLAALRTETQVFIAAPTYTEALIVAGRRGLATQVSRLVSRLNISVVALDEAAAQRAAEAYARWGKGVHPAKLNFGDTFSYELARRLDCPLLFVGDDFAQTDVRSALAA